MLEKSIFPRDKICGDALSGKVVEVLKKYDTSLVQQMASDPEHFLGSWGVTFVAPNGKALDIPFKQDRAAQPHAPGFISRRMYFDAFLSEQLNPDFATLITGAEIQSIHKSSNRLNIVYQQNKEQKEL